MNADRVLIVEDDSSIGMVVRSALEAEGIDVDVCESASARDAALAGNRYDLMLTDDPSQSFCSFTFIIVRSDFPNDFAGLFADDRKNICLPTIKDNIVRMEALITSIIPLVGT